MKIQGVKILFDLKFSLFLLSCISIEDEYVVQAGDRVEFRTIPMPPKKVERMAVEVHLISLSDDKPHERWDQQPDL